jgi:hypothetical protein
MPAKQTRESIEAELNAGRSSALAQLAQLGVGFGYFPGFCIA